MTMSDFKKNWRYHPLNGKVPLLTGWPEKASNDPVQIEAWKREYPGCNLGIACDVITVLDLDIKHVDGTETLAKLERAHEPLPQTYTVKTQSGGLQFYFNHVSGLKNAVSFAPGLDIRTMSADGKMGQVVAYPPTIDTAPADMPQWLIDVIKGGKQPAILDVRQGKIQRGEWHAALVRQAGKLRNMNLTAVGIENALLDFARNNFSDQNIDVAHVKQIAADATKWEAASASSEETTTLITPLASWTHRKPQLWSWKPVMRVGGMLNLSGESSQGKSPITVDWAARLSRLTPGMRGEAVWPDGQPIARAPLHTIMLNSEDDLQDTILPRFDLAGGYDMFFHLITGVRVSKDDKHHQRMLALKEDIRLLCEFARKISPELGMITVDPITNYLGKGMRMNAEEDVRHILMPLVGLAQELGITVVTVSHLNKGEGDPMSRVMGARAFVGVARDAWQCVDDPDSENKYAHIFGPVRGPKASQSFKYHTEVVPVEIGGEMSDVIKIVWDGRSNATVAQGLDQEAKKNLSGDKEAAIELKNLLTAGKRAASDCQSFLKSCGFKVENMNFSRVRKLAGAEHRQEGVSGGGSKSVWYLPSAQQEFEPPAARKDDDAPKY
jgi:hypothetical protein